MYQDSVDILGVSMDELQEFVDAGEGRVSKGEHELLYKLERLTELQDQQLNEQLDQVCEKALGLLSSL